MIQSTGLFIEKCPLNNGERKVWLFLAHLVSFCLLVINDLLEIPVPLNWDDATASRPGYLASATGLRSYLDLRTDSLLQGRYV